MILQKQKVYVPVTEGLDSRTDERFVVQGQVVLLENGVYKEEGRIDKRNGFSNYTLNILGGGTLSSAKGIYSYNNELLCESNGTLYSYSPELAAWVSKGTLVRTSTSTETVIRNNDQQRDLSFADIGTMRLYAWTETNASAIRYSVQDTTTGVYFVYNATVDSNSGPRVVASDTHFYIVYQNNTNTITTRAVAVATPTTLGSAVNVVTSLAVSNNFWDVARAGSNFFLSWFNTSSDLITRKYDLTFATVTTNTYTPADLDNVISMAVSTVAGASKIHVAWYASTGARTHVRILDTDLNVDLADTAFTSGTGTITAISGTQIATSSHNVQWFVSNTYSATSYDNRTATGVMGTSGEVTDLTTARRNFRVATKAFTINSVPYVGTVIVQDNQSSLFIVDSSLNIVAKISPGETGDMASGKPWSAVVSGDTVYVAYNRKGEYNHEGNTHETLLGYSIATVNFGASTSASTAVLNDILYIASGALHIYDGVGAVEEGFTYYPTVYSASPSVTAGDIADGDYQYVGMYEWLDNQGNLHRSAPSNAVSATMNIGPASMLVDLDQLNLTEKDSNGRKCKQVLYRTTEGPGSVFYRVDEFTNAIGGTVNSILDDLADADITDNEILYTQGGILENIQAPACDIVVTHGDRLVIGGLEDGNVSRVSKPAQLAVGPGFNEGLEIRINPKGGRVLDIFSMDDKLVFMKNNAIYWVSGAGPDATGAGSFTEPQVLTDMVGIENKNAGISTPIGIIFKSEKGFCLLDRSLNLDSNFGAPVYDYNSNTVSSCVSVPNQDEVRFCTTDGNILVYNYRVGKWSVYTGLASVGSCIFDGKHVLITSAGQAKYEDSTTHLDNSAFVSLKVKTGWIQIDARGNSLDQSAGIEGLQRIYRANVVGKYHTPHKLKSEISYDGNNSVVETHLLEVTADPKQYGYEIRPKRQKCSAIQYTISDVAPTSGTGTGQGFSLSGLRLLCGVKPKLNNTPASRKL